MINKYRTIKIVILFILLFQVFNLISVKNTSAQDNSPIRLKTNFDIYWTDLEDPIVPRDEIKELNLTVECSLGYGLDLSKGYYLNYVNYEKYEANIVKDVPRTAKARLELDILEKPSWCQVSFLSHFVNINISEKYIAQTQMYMIIDEDAPAYTQGIIKINAKIMNINPAPIQGDERIFELSFKPSFNPRINVELPKINTVDIEPYQTAEFPIKVTNLGNEETRVIIEVKNLPDDWTASVSNELILNLNETKNAILVIKPPREFGYREDIGIVRVSITPTRAYSSDLSEAGEEMTVSFLVKSKGFFIEGEGLYQFILITLVIIVILLIVSSFVKRRVLKQ